MIPLENAQEHEGLVKTEAPITTPSERQQLEQEKKELAVKLGIWGEYTPVDNYDSTPEFKRIREIDKRLFEIITE